jgi:hypothetical protein
MRQLICCLPLFLAMPAPAAENSPLQAFGFLAGYCWSGEYADTQAVDTHCYTWVYGGKHLRDVHVVKGDGPDYEGETIYSVDGKTGGVIYRYWNSLGGVSDGKIEFADGALVSAAETYVGEDGKPREFRSSLRSLSETEYEARTEERIDGQWSDFSRTVFTRGEAASP